ncbi:MAG: S8 family serine peptidase [Candidatus Cloacimonadaceae bacterium]|nr:S8 family serine peptidase [Candidatus Cloacimonadaceae bacterium]
MKTTLLLLVTIFFTFGLLCADALPGENIEKPLFAQDRIKIKLSSDAILRTSLPQGLYAEAGSFGINELDQLFARYSGRRIIRAHRRVDDQTWESNTGFDRWFVILLDGKADVAAAIASFKANRYVEDAILEYLAYSTAVPNDTFYPNNWGHNNTAQLPVYQSGSHSGPGVGTIGFDSRAQLAWDKSQGYGSAAVIIAIIDTGVDTAHLDLRLVTGYDFGDNDNNPMDDSSQKGHGTACAGVAAARANNSLGVTGIAGGSSVMPLKVANSAGTMTFTAIANAITYAANNGAHIVSLSLGAYVSYGYDSATDNAIAYAYNQGVCIFAATGNYSSSNTTQDFVNYPANHPNVISVAAASPTAQRKSYTSSDGETWWGSIYCKTSEPQDHRASVDITAPTILPTTDISGATGYSTTDYYMWFNGTSCATPYVAGVAALLKSQSPSLTPAQIRSVLTSSATDMTIDGGAGWDRFTGYGMINANAALTLIELNPPTCVITQPLTGEKLIIGDQINVLVNAQDPAPGSVVRVEFYLDASPTPVFIDYSAPYSWFWNSGGASLGNHTIVAKAIDNDNNITAAQIIVNLLYPADEGFETNNFNTLDWTHSGNLPWTTQTVEKYYGNYAAGSGAITHNQSSSLSIQLDVAQAGNITFYQRVSSEASYDYLRFFIDGIQQGQWSGAGLWAMQSYAVSAGARTFSWTYSKDGTVSSNSDRAWIDHITFPLYQGDLTAPFAEGFEAGWNGWKTVNGTQTNIWETGNAISHTGIKSAYISNNAGTSNAYSLTNASVSHLYQRIVFPSSTEGFKLRFAWKGNGQTTLDGMKVYLVDPSIAPVAGTQLGSGQIGTLYNLNNTWQEDTIDLGTAPSGQTKRLVFTWFNDNSAGTQPPIAVDNIRVIIGSQSDAAVVINQSVSVSPPPVNDPQSNPLSPQITVTNLSGDIDFIIVKTSYAPPEVNLPEAGLCLSFYGGSFAGSTINVIHNLGFVPNRIAYLLGEGGGWNLITNTGSWTNSSLAITIPTAKAGEYLILAFPNNQDSTLPVTLSSFNAVLSNQNYVRLDWVTQTESGALGYYLHRHDSDQLDSAIMVSPLILATNTSQQQSYSFTDSETEAGTIYYYWLQSMDMDGWTQYHGPIHITTASTDNGIPNIPLVTEVRQAYPNPFNPNTTIGYSIHKAGYVSLDIFNVRGQKLRSYERIHESPGHYLINFDGRDSGGRALASGIYYYRFRSGDYASIRKMLLSK